MQLEAKLTEFGIVLEITVEYSHGGMKGDRGRRKWRYNKPPSLTTYTQARQRHGDTYVKSTSNRSAMVKWTVADA
jgi:hypothetical protein